MTVELRDYSDDELKRLPPLKVGYNHLRNPFHRLTHDPLGAKLANRWAWIWWPGDMAAVNGESESDGGEVDPFDAMMEALARKRSGFHRADGPGGCALFPSVPNHPPGSDARRKLEAEWEARSITMHEGQEPVTVEEKPVQNFADYIRMKRGD